VEVRFIRLIAGVSLAVGGVLGHVPAGAGEPPVATGYELHAVRLPDGSHDVEFTSSTPCPPQSGVTPRGRLTFESPRQVTTVRVPPEGGNWTASLTLPPGAEGAIFADCVSGPTSVVALHYGPEVVDSNSPCGSLFHCPAPLRPTVTTSSEPALAPVLLAQPASPTIGRPRFTG
jgi:hypothetical protein